MKKIIFLLLTTLLPMAANAHDIEVPNGDGVTIYYNFTNDSTELEVTFRGDNYISYRDEYTGNVVIPEEVTYMNSIYKVTRIGNDAFLECSGLTSVTIPNSVTSIGKYAFRGCFDLTSIIIPNGVTSILPETFYGCVSLASVTIPNSVTSIEAGAFEGCYCLTSVTIPNSVTSIGSRAFADCYGLTSITISNSLMSIGRSAFMGCFSLTSIAIPNGVTSILQETFYGCSSLASVTIANSVTSIGEWSFAGCSSLTSITIPNSITSIGDGAFQDCSGLTSITIPNSVTSILQETFSNCSSLASVTISNSVTSIGDLAFSDCSSLTSITIPNSVTSIGGGAFAYCSGLTSITIPNSVTSIGGGAFQNCSGLTSITIPNSVTSIGNDAFYNCSGLTSVTIGNSVTSIGYYAFNGSSDLTSVTVLNPTPIEITQDVFSNRNNATLYVPAASIDAYRNVSPWNEFGAIVPLEDQVAYRPFVEDGKVWKVGSTTGISDGVVKMVEYYYFDGDTIIDGKTCKQMMCQRYVSPDHPDYDVMIQIPSLRNIGAWYEEDKKVYLYNAQSKQYKMMYDFSLEANETFLIDDYYSYVIGPKQTGGLEGFKDVYRDVMWYDEEEPYYNTTWLEGVGGIDGPTVNVYYGKEGHGLFLMSCSVGDEVIYLNDDYEDGASIDAAGARKDRFDFVHIIKPRPKAPSKQEESDASIMAKAPSKESEEPIYGEYNELQLDINLNPLADAYMVSITNEAGKAVYEKAINAGSIVGLNIDISAYTKGRYTVTMENSLESFTGEFDVQTTGITEVTYNNKVKIRTDIFNLQGQRISSLQKGLNIVNGRKVVIK